MDLHLDTPLVVFVDNHITYQALQVNYVFKISVDPSGASPADLSPQAIGSSPEDPMTMMPSRSSSDSESSYCLLLPAKDPGCEKIRYFFEGSEAGLICTLQFSVPAQLTRQFIASMIALVDVQNISTYCKPFMHIDRSAGFFKIGLRDLNDSRAFQVFIDFIHHLEEMGINELHENKYALWFYTNNGGDEILNVHNYPVTLQTFLKQEALAVSAFLSKHEATYSTFVEVGCGHMVNLPLANQHQLRYLGLDFSPIAIRNVQAELQRSPDKYPNVQVECFNILQLNRVKDLFQSGEKPLFFLPFNLFGNIAPIILFMARLRKQKFDVLISMYKTDDKTNAMRQAYYTNCGYKTITVITGETGTTFYSEEGLYTVAYHPTYLINLFKRVGFQVSLIEAGTYGYLLAASPMPLNEPTLKISPVLASPIGLVSPAESKRSTPPPLALPSQGSGKEDGVAAFMLKVGAVSGAACMASVVLSAYAKKPTTQRFFSNVNLVTAATTLVSLGSLLYKQGFWKRTPPPEAPSSFCRPNRLEQNN